jgi:hypothetical protein
VPTNARMFSANERFAEPAPVDGAVGIVVAPNGGLALVRRYGVTDDKIARIDLDAERERPHGFSLAMLG